MARAGDIIATEEFRDVELAIEWKVAPGAILDDAKHPDGQAPLTSAGPNDGLYSGPRDRGSHRLLEPPLAGRLPNRFKVTAM